VTFRGGATAEAPIVASVASEQMLREAGGRPPGVPPEPQPGGPPAEGVQPSAPGQPTQTARPKRFFGTIRLEPARVGRDAGRVAEEVILHLAALPGANAEVILEIQIRAPDGIPESLVRTII
jgi:hypothetical protein